MTPRKATLKDVEMLAQLHVQAWHECYAGLGNRNPRSGGSQENMDQNYGDADWSCVAY